MYRNYGIHTNSVLQTNICSSGKMPYAYYLFVLLALSLVRVAWTAALGLGCIWKWCFRKSLHNFFSPIFHGVPVWYVNKHEKMQVNQNISRGSVQQSDNHLFQKYDLI